MSKTKPKENTEKKRNLKFIIPILLILIFVGWASFSIIKPDADSNGAELLRGNDTLSIDTAGKKDAAFMKAVSADSGDTSVYVVKMSVPFNSNIPCGTDDYAGKNIKRVYDGRRINVAITGLDARVGTVSNHADANHILSIMPDSGIIEIITIPRDTPADAGMPDTSNQNKLTIVRSNRGREAYLKEAAKIAGLDKIHYYVEVSFSQVMGILELFGYSDTKSVLQVLRSRKGLGGDDYQRCYNQAQFIRQMILKHFNRVNSTLGDLIIRGGLALVESNLTANTINSLIEQLSKKGFSKNPNQVVVKVRPPMGMQFKVYDFTDKAVVQNMKSKIEHFNVTTEHQDTVKKVVNVTYKLKQALNKAIADSAKKPQSVISGLEIYFNQRAWFQVENKQERNQIRDQFEILLYNAYMKRKMPDKAKKLKEVMYNEKQLFNKQIF